jgi:hypothetical protein
MKFINLTLALLLLAVVTAQADMEPGAQVPNPTLVSLDGKEVQLHSLLSQVTVLHLWKCQ